MFEEGEYVVLYNCLYVVVVFFQKYWTSIKSHYISALLYTWTSVIDLDSLKRNYWHLNLIIALSFLLYIFASEIMYKGANKDVNLN